MQKHTEQEPGILKKEIVEAIKSAGNNNAHEIDNVLLELTVAAGELGL